MQVLIACEFSGVVRDAFRARGHDAWSCDLLPSEREGPHLIGDAREIAYNRHWDLMIFHWPCTDMAVSGAKWFKAKQEKQAQAVADFQYMMAAPIEKIAGENPISVLSTKYRKPDQIIQPWQFWHLNESGKGERKATCLWLKGLPRLMPTTPGETGRHPACWLMPPSPDRGQKRSRTYPGIADAFAEQWG